MLYHGDCMQVLKDISDNSIDACITDPPYFLDGMDGKWDHTKVSSKKNMKVVTSLASGMRFDRNQGKKFYEWYKKVSEELLRVLKPGAFFLSFSSPRLYHNMASAVEDAGFAIKDQFIWLYTQNQPKAMSLNHVIDRLNVTHEEKDRLKAELAGWKTPQVKSCHEPILMAQKPLIGSFLENHLEYGVGLVNTRTLVGDSMFPSNVVSTDEFDETVDRYFLVSKPNKKEKEGNIHLTVKPLELCRYLIGLTTREEDVVIDPCMGSGTTCVAAKQMNRQYVGIDLNEEYVAIAKRRLSDE